MKFKLIEFKKLSWLRRQLTFHTHSFKIKYKHKTYNLTTNIGDERDRSTIIRDMAYEISRAIRKENIKSIKQKTETAIKNIENSVGRILDTDEA